MSRVTYGVTAEEYQYKGARRSSYGIAAYSDAERDGSACIIASVRDLSTDRGAVEALVDLCNKEALSVIHLSDVAEDFLTTL